MYPSFKDDKRYLAILGNPGSNPLELFWDVVDGLDQKLDEKIEIVEAAIKKHNDKLAPADAENAAEKEKDVDMADDKAKAKDKAKEEADPNAPKLFKVAPETTKKEFLSIVKRDEEVAKKLKPEDLDEVFETVCGYVLFRVSILRFMSSYHSYKRLLSSNEPTRSAVLRDGKGICKMTCVML